MLNARVNTLNTELQRLLLPAFKRVFLKLLKKPIEIAFVLDLKTQDFQDKRPFGQSSLGGTRHTSFFLCFELFKFAEKGAKCDILSLEECKRVNGARLQMNHEIVEAALILFHHQNTRTAPLEPPCCNI